MNARTISYSFGLLMLLITLLSIAGCDIGDFLRVQTPPSVQQAEGLPSTLTLNESEREYRAWQDEVRRSAAEWRENIGQSHQVAALLSQITLQSLDSVGPTLAGLPVLGPSLPALTGLLGVFLGTGHLRKQKEKSFNKGLEEGRKPQPPTAGQPPPAPIAT